MDIDKNQIQEIIDGLRVYNPHTVVDETVKQLKALIEPKWEPKVYEPNFYIGRNGLISISDLIYNPDRLYGGEWPTIEAAETARDMNKRNQLILQYKLEKGFGDGGWIIVYHERREQWEVLNASDQPENPELTFETREQAVETLKAVGLNES